MQEAKLFYDGFADSYQFLFADWKQSVIRQGKSISRFLETLGYTAPAKVLDCTCGIGTQAIALALMGYEVVGQDLSEKSIEQARQNAVNFSLDRPVHFAVADLLQPPTHSSEYEIALAYDNAIAHFLTEQDLMTAFSHMKTYLKDGGLLTISLRDYDTLAQQMQRHSHISVHDEDDGRLVMFQVWDWHENGHEYRSEMFIIKQIEGIWHTQTYQAPFRAWKRTEVQQIAIQAGLMDVVWHMPEETQFYQPIMSAQKSQL